MPAKLLSCSFLTLSLPWFSPSPFLFIPWLSRCLFFFIYFVCCIFLTFSTSACISSSSSPLFPVCYLHRHCPAESCIVAVGGCEFEEWSTAMHTQRRIKPKSQALCVQTLRIFVRIFTDFFYSQRTLSDLTRSCFSTAELCPHETVFVKKETTALQPRGLEKVPTNLSLEAALP